MNQSSYSNAMVKSTMMIVLTIFSVSLALAAGYLQVPRIPDEMQKFYYEIDSAQNEHPVRVNTNEDPLSDEFIRKINRMQSTWKAGRNFHKQIPMGYIRNLMGVHEDAHLHQLPLLKTYTYRANSDLPEEFDARLKWPNCPTIGEIRDQGSCGSCWAFGAVESMSDRVCIHSNGTKNVHLSAEDLISCCYFCGFNCMGGFPGMAWRHWVSSGIVSGGAYESNQGCRPYEVAPCEHEGTIGPRPACHSGFKWLGCHRQCQPNYKISYDNDRTYGAKAYGLKGDEQSIKQEIFDNGPVEASYTVYADFLHYKSGVYQHVAGDKMGGHAVRILGWGVDKKTSTPYWLVANSWNTDWGDHGFFKIKRGGNECGIEGGINSGLPKV